MRYIKTINLWQIFCELLKPCWEFVTIFMEIKLEIRKQKANATLSGYRKTRFDLKTVF